MNKFAAFRLAVFYFEDFPSAEVKRRLGFHDMEQGGNVWLVTPDDEGVVHGASEHEGIRCVHPVQIYLDLKDHPERSEEAARELRAMLLKQYSDV